MSITLIASGTLTVNTLGVSQSLASVITTPGFYFLDTDVSAGQGGDSINLAAYNATLINGAQSQEDTTGTVALPQVSGNLHLQLGPDICSNSSPGLSFTMTYNGTKRAIPWSIWQVA